METITKETIIAELAAVGVAITPNGIYATLPQIILNGIDYSRTFGYEAWKKTSCTGPVVNNIVIKYAISSHTLA